MLPIDLGSYNLQEFILSQNSLTAVSDLIIAQFHGRTID